MESHTSTLALPNAQRQTLSPSSSSSIGVLSDDVLIHILLTLPIRDQLTIRQVCRRWLRTCDGDRLWRRLCTTAGSAIAPLPPTTWRMLGQRLSCQKWVHRSGDNDAANDMMVAPTDASPTTTSSPVTNTPQPAATTSGPKGEWVTVLRTGIQYVTYPDAILPLADIIASSKPLSDHRGNNTATIGLIPIGLVGGGGGEGGEAFAPNSASSSSLHSHDDPAVSLHKKLFSAMGIDFEGDWNDLCRVMRPHDEKVSSMAGAGGGSTTNTTAAAAAASAAALRRQQQHQQQRPALTVSDIDFDILRNRYQSAANVNGASLLREDPTAPSIAVFDTMPHMGPRRVMAMCLSPGKAEAHPISTARLAETLFTTCSTVVFAAKDAEALRQWLGLVSPHMSMVPSPSPFSTADNTPNVLFMTSTPIDSLRDVLTDGASERGSAAGSTSSLTPAVEGVTRSPPPPPPPQQVRTTSPNRTREVFSWVLNRSSCVGEVVFDDESCPLSLKTYYAPAWVAPQCSLPVPAPAVIRMLLAAGDAQGAASTVERLWTRDVVEAMCDGQSRQCSVFYEQAMRTEISDANRPLIAFTDLPVPMDPAEVVSIQDHFFYASLRSYAMVVRHACGSDTALGIALLEEFKKNISTCFRKLWAENIAMSRAYCTRLFESIFHPLHDKYNGEASNGFQDRRGLHTWFGAVTDKISEYIIKAKGPRKFDVLAERITTRTIGGLKNFCLQHPEHPHVRIEDVNLAADEITAYCAKQLTAYHAEQDEILSVKQRNSAMYTACMGTMWGCEAVSEAIKYLSMLGPEYDTWSELLQLKREGFGLAPTAVLSLTVSSPAQQPLAGEEDTEEASETNSVSASSGIHSTSAVATSRSRASSSHNPSTPTAPPAPASEGVLSMFASLWSRGTTTTTATAATSSPPPQNHTSSAASGDGSSRIRRRGLFSASSSPKKKKGPLPSSVVLTELEVERQGQLQALMCKHAEHKLRMEAIGKQLNLRTDETADFNVIQRQFSSGFKDYRTTRKMEEAADEIATKLRAMRERVRNSFASTRER